MLTDQQKAILDIEARWYRYSGAKAQAIRAELDLSELRYYQLLNRLLDDPEALSHAPQMVNRLRRLRAQRRRRAA